MAKIFISHSSRDAEQAAWMKAWLHERGFQEVFLDFDKHAGLQPGSHWEKDLYTNIEQSEAMIIIATPNWLESKWCFAEFTQARALGKPIFPIIETPIGERLVSPDIQHLNLLSDREGGLERLSGELTRIALDAQGGFPWDARRAPYPGLLAFSEDDAAIYFGRDDDIRSLIERLNIRRVHGVKKLIALLGASGAGKSSLLRAGVIPRLRRDVAHWFIVPPFRPHTRPIEELAMALALALDDKGRWGALAQQLADDGGGAALRKVANELRLKSGATSTHILLPIDQGEELFTMGQREDAQRFLRLLSEALDGETPLIALMTIRSNMLDALQSETALTARFEEFSLKPMPLSRIGEIIEGPARVAGFDVDRRLVLQAVHDARTEDALPLLAFTLRSLYDQFGGDGNITYEDYVSLGDFEYRASGDDKVGLNPIENAIRRRADEVIADIAASEAELAALRDSFSSHLVHIDDNGEYARQTAPFAKLPVDAHRAIASLVNAHLLVTRSEEGEQVIEVAHESLLRKWPLLRGWLDEEGEFLTGRQRLNQDLRDWENAAGAEKRSALLSGLKLARAQFWRTQWPERLSDAQKRFIDASIARADEEKALELQRIKRIRKFQLAFSSALAVVLVLMLAVTAREVWQARATAIRTSQLLADRARTAFEQGYCDRAMRYAVAGLPLPRGPFPTAWSREAEIELQVAAADCALLHVLTGHGEDVNGASVSPDDTRILTAGEDRKAILWNADDGLIIKELEHNGPVRQGTFDRESRLLVTASDDHTARIWNAATGAAEMTLIGHSRSIYTAYFDSTGRRVVTASEDRTAAIWDIASGFMLHQLSGHGGPVKRAFFYADGSRVVTVSDDSTARIWDVAEGSVIATLAEHTGPVRAATQSPDGRYLVTASSDATARIWDATTGAPVRTLAGHGGPVLEAIYDHRGRRIATASSDKTVRIWDAETGALKFVLSGQGSSVVSLAFFPDDERLITGSHDGTAQIWDLNAGLSVAVLRGHEASLEGLTLSRNGSRIVTASHDKTARVWDASGERRGRILGSYLSPSEAFALDADSARVAIGSSDGNVRIFHLAEMREGPILRGHTRAVTSIAFSANGRVLATCSFDGTVRLWDGETYAPLRTFDEHSGMVQSVALSADGSLVLSGSHDSTARLWRSDGGPAGPVLKHGWLVYSVAFSPDGRTIATASMDETAALWETAGGNMLFPLTGHKGAVWSVNFNRDGTRLVTAGDDKTARIWDTATGREIAILTGHESPLSTAVFSPNGATVLTTSDDKTARLWRAADGEQLLVLRGHSGDVKHGDINSDGSRAITASRDGTARLWDLETGAMIAVLRGHAGQVEMAKFVKGDKAVITTSQDGTARRWDVAHPRPPSTMQLRERVCRDLRGAREFTPQEMQDPFLSSDASLKSPCERRSFFIFEALFGRR